MPTGTRESEIVAMAVGVREAFGVIDVREVVVVRFLTTRHQKDSSSKKDWLGEKAPTLDSDLEIQFFVYTMTISLP